MEFLLLMFLAYGVIIGAFCAYLAGEKGRSGGSWFFLGLVFGILALLVLIGLPSEQRSSTGNRRPSAESTATPRTGGRREGSDGRLCPHCIQEVHELAAVCPHCQRDLPKLERCSYGPCGKIINPTDVRCEDDEGNLYCGNLDRRRGNRDRRRDDLDRGRNDLDRRRNIRVQCPKCRRKVLKDNLATHQLNHLS